MTRTTHLCLTLRGRLSPFLACNTWTRQSTTTAPRNQSTTTRCAPLRTVPLAAMFPFLARNRVPLRCDVVLRHFASTPGREKETLIKEDERTARPVADSDASSTSHSPAPTWETLRRLVDFAAPEHSLIAASAATLLVTSSTTLVLPMASGHVLDMILSGDSTLAPPVVAAGLFGLTAVAGAGVYARTLWLQQAGNTMVARLKEKLFGAMVYQDMTYLEQQKTGDFVTRLSQDTTLIQAAVTTQAVAALRGIVMTAGSTLLLWHTSPTLALVSVATLPPLFVGARLAGQKLRAQQRQVQTLHSQSTAVAEQALQGIATVVQFGAQDQEWQRYQTAVQEAHNQAIRTGRIQALLEGGVHIAANGAVLCVLGYGGSMVVAGTLTVGDLTGFLMYSLLLAGNVSGLSGTYAEVSKAVAAADRVWEVMDRIPAIPSSSSTKEEQSASTTTSTKDYSLSIEFRNIQFSYPTRPKKTILGPQFTLTVNPGEVLSIVGESGCGKSTLAKLLTRLYDIDETGVQSTDGVRSVDSSSAILISGKDIRDWDPQELRQNVIGIVSQEPWLLDGTLAENIRYGRPTATDDEVRVAASLAHVWSFASGFPKGLDTPVGSRGGTQLSGGQRQRVAIARLLLKDPPIVILDEATSALDASSEALVQKALESVMTGRTVVSIAHRLSTIRNADRIAVLRDGVVVEVGTFDELSQKHDGAFRSLMGRQLV